MPRNYERKITRGDIPPDVMEKAARKVVDEKKSLRDVAVKQRMVDEMNERKSKPKEATDIVVVIFIAIPLTVLTVV
ncbi:Hypothetical predicted protein [Octopus vulgaris]|uniref:Uncharacterized protein n=1 Tax=Octopus vulgaris TaxID=6645 RepID=A0AA36BP86_OCTVU|nr:Hypothetical predicted protein [Octopus vulgaris]